MEDIIKLAARVTIGIVTSLTWSGMHAEMGHIDKKELLSRKTIYEATIAGAITGTMHQFLKRRSISATTFINLILSMIIKVTILPNRAISSLFAESQYIEFTSSAIEDLAMISKTL